MKKIRTQSLAGVALTCLALAAGSASAAIPNITVSTFDSDLTGFGTNITTTYVTNTDSTITTNTSYSYNSWSTAAVHVTSLYWTNVTASGGGAPGGSMYDITTFDTGNSGWQDAQINYGFVNPGINLRQYTTVEFDVMIDPVHSTGGQNGGNWGGVQVVCQGWDGWGDNVGDQGWNILAAPALVPTNMPTGAWQHIVAPCSGYQHYLSSLTFSFYVNPGSNVICYMIDNVKILNPLFVPRPPLNTAPAYAGLNIFNATTDDNTRQSLSTGQNSDLNFIGKGSSVSTYGFTVSKYVMADGVTPALNGQIHMFLVPDGSTAGAPDWNEPNCIFMELRVAGTDNHAAWTFRYKTNSPAANGMIYDTNTYQAFVTNPTFTGSWMLSVKNDNQWTMTSPSGDTTNFSLPIDPSIWNGTSGSMQVFWGVQALADSIQGAEVVMSSVIADVPGSFGWYNNHSFGVGFTTNLDVTTPIWTKTASSAPTAVQVVPANATWLRWTLPGSAYYVITNSSVKNPAGWNTNGLDSTKFTIANQEYMLMTTNTNFTKVPVLWPQKVGNLFFGLEIPQ